MTFSMAVSIAAVVVSLASVAFTLHARRRIRRARDQILDADRRFWAAHDRLRDSVERSSGRHKHLNGDGRR